MKIQNLPAIIIQTLRRLYWFIFRPTTRGVRVILYSDRALSAETGLRERFLLVKHSYDPLWYLPGGGLHRDEEPAIGALREIKEELGIDLNEEELEFFGEYINDGEYKKDTIYVFAACVGADVLESIVGGIGSERSEQRSNKGRMKWSSFEIEKVVLVGEEELGNALSGGQRANKKPASVKISPATKLRLLEYLARRPKSSEWLPRQSQGQTQEKNQKWGQNQGRGQIMENIHEYYQGSEEDIGFIKQYSKSVRSVSPREMCIYKDAVRVAEIVSSPINTSSLDRDFLVRCLDFFKELLPGYSSQLTIFDPTRFYVSEIYEGGEIGGFHSKISLGYQYFFDAAYVGLVNAQIVSDKRLAVYEFMRSFAHDTIHRSTYRSWRRRERHAANPSEAKHIVPSVYRYQYGVNFRNADGVPYSSASLTALGPQKINLNLMMDGITVIKAAEMVREMIEKFGIGPLSQLENALLDEITLKNTQASTLPESVRKFNWDVVIPTMKFLEYWGGGGEGTKYFTRLLFDAMMSGDLRRVKKFFATKTGDENFWENNFKQESFRE